MTFAVSGTESSSSLQMMTDVSREHASSQLTGATLASGDLRKRGLDFGIKRVSSHDENNAACQLRSIDS